MAEDARYLRTPMPYNITARLPRPRYVFWPIVYSDSGLIATLCRGAPKIPQHARSSMLSLLRRSPLDPHGMRRLPQGAIPVQKTVMPRNLLRLYRLRYVFRSRHPIPTCSSLRRRGSRHTSPSPSAVAMVVPLLRSPTSPRRCFRKRLSRNPTQMQIHRIFLRAHVWLRSRVEKHLRFRFPRDPPLGGSARPPSGRRRHLLSVPLHRLLRMDHAR